MAKIILGPAKGLRYKINAISGLSPIFGYEERHVQKTLVKLVKKDMVVYDVGANWGLFTILLSRLVGERGHIYSFEPIPYNAELIKDNLNSNNMHNVYIILKAVSDSTGMKHFDVSKGYKMGHLIEDRANNGIYSIQVDCIALDDFVFSENNPSPQLIKIDVEGSESKVLDGASRLIDKFKPIIVCELHNPTQDVLVGKILIKHHYGAIRLKDGRLVKDLDKGWPSPTGLWGHFVGYHLEKTMVIQGLFRKK